VPLTSKGQEIMANMKKQYGEKKGEQVFYASKNAGKITGVDASGYEEGEGGVGAESWQGSRKHSSGYRISTGESADQYSTMVTGVADPHGGVRDMRLPSLDQFRRQFRDAVRAGLPLQKCLDLGTVWNGSSPSGKKFKGDARRAFVDAIRQGKSIRDAVADAEKEAPPQRADLGKTSGEGMPMADRRLHFRGAIRDAMKQGKSSRDAISHALGQMI
jgi:hypothetical protein